MNQTNTTIAFIINSLEGGGAERVMCKLLSIMEKDFAALNLDVHLILLDDLPQAHCPPSYVRKHVLDTKGSLHNGYSALKTVLRAIKPTLCVSFLTRSNLLNVATSKKLGHRTIISERVNTSSHLSGGIKDIISKCLVRMTYPSAHAVIAVSEGVKADLVDNFGVPENRISTIYNPYNVKTITTMASEQVDDLPANPYVIATGRLVKNKNFSLLLESLAASQLTHDLVILGQGEEREALEDKAQALGIAHRVHFLGFKNNPYPYLFHSDFFVSTSNAEGFPNAIAEAMCLGKAVIATNCESGPAEILTGEYPYSVKGFKAEAFGCICEVNNVQGVTDALNFFSDDDRVQNYAKRSEQRASAFSNKLFKQRFHEVLGLTNKTRISDHVSVS